MMCKPCKNIWFRRYIWNMIGWVELTRPAVEGMRNKAYKYLL